MSLDIFFIYFQKSIRAHVRHRAFATLQIELYRVVVYDSKWSTKFHKDCMLEIFYFTFKTSFYNKKLIFKMSGPQLLQQSKVNWTMQ